MLEWACGPDDDLSDPAVVKRANPASFVTEDFLAEQIASPGLTPWEFARYHANVWTAGDEGWLPPKAWAGCEEQGLELPPGADVWLGVDIGLKKDRAALVAVSPLEDDRARFAAAAVEIFDPPGEGWSLDLAEVEQAIRDAAERWIVRGVVYDPWQFVRSSELLSDEGLLMIEFPQRNERMCPASHALYDAIVSGRLAHAGERRFADHVAAGAKTWTERGWRLTKRKAKKPMDALIALCIAFSVASSEGGKSVYESRGLLVF